MGLRPWQGCSNFVWERACRLATDHPFRQAARLLSDLVGTPVDHRRLWGWLQKAGTIRRAELERWRAEMFDEGLAPPEGEPVEMVVTEIDGAILRQQRSGVFEAKIAVAYTGKRRTSVTARHRKLLCTGKTVAAGVFTEGAGGPTIYAQLCRSVHLHRARWSLLSGDGAEWIPVLAREWFPGSVYQLDHYHLKMRLREAAGRDTRRASQWIAWALAGRFRTIERSMAALVRQRRLSPELARETLWYLRMNGGAIWAFRSLLAQGAPPELCTRGSGVIEHTVDLGVARRMKRQGMRWSKGGAHNLLVMKAMRFDANGWRTWWKEVIG
jgi:hypothetical protein